MSDLLALASNDYGCCENGVDFATLLALIAGKTHQKFALIIVEEKVKVAFYRNCFGHLFSTFANHHLDTRQTIFAFFTSN